MARNLRKGDVVLTPMGRRAQVSEISEEGFLTVNYIDELGPLDRRAGTIHERLVRRIFANREMPEPVRLDHRGVLVG